MRITGYIVGLSLAWLLAACGTMAPQPESIAHPPQAGLWSLQYSGSCAGRESESIQITRLNETEIVFDDFRLPRDEQGQYSGSANFIAPMPADGREIIYTIVYALSVNETGGFSGTETIIEGGGHEISCPIELVFVGVE